MNRRTLLLAVAALAAIWGSVLAVLKVTEKHTSTPEKVLDVMAAAPWLADEPATVSDEDRRKALEAVIVQINLLDFEQRRRMREEEGQETAGRFFNSLSKEEKSYFLERTVESHFKSVMKAFNQMSPQDRKEAVRRARADMKRNQVDGQNLERLQAEDERVFEKLVEKGLGAYYEEASAETKMDLAPLMEEMQQRLRSMPGR